MSRNEEIKSLIDELEPDMEKFYEKGNKAAGTRARKTLQELKKLAQEVRLEIQDKKNSDDL
jgi:hypothetical protein